MTCHHQKMIKRLSSILMKCHFSILSIKPDRNFLWCVHFASILDFRNIFLQNKNLRTNTEKLYFLWTTKHSFFTTLVWPMTPLACTRFCRSIVHTSWLKTTITTATSYVYNKTYCISNAVLMITCTVICCLLSSSHFTSLNYNKLPVIDIKKVR